MECVLQIDTRRAHRLIEMNQKKSEPKTINNKMLTKKFNQNAFNSSAHCQTIFRRLETMKEKSSRKIQKFEMKTTRIERIYYVFNFIVIGAHIHTHTHSPYLKMCTGSRIRHNPYNNIIQGYFNWKLHCGFFWTQIDTNRNSIETNAHSGPCVSRRLIGRGFQLPELTILKE